MEIFVSRTAKHLVPIPPAQLREMQGRGVVFPMDLVWTEGAQDWRPLYQIPELASVSQPVALAPVIADGGVEADRSVTEQDIAVFAGTNSDHYVEGWKSLRASKLNILGNRAAIFFGAFWCLYRKMYLCATVLAVIVIAWGWLAESQGWNQSAGYAPFILFGALLADRLYLRRAEKRIAAIKAQCSNRREQKDQIARAGGTNLALALIVGLPLTVAAFAGVLLPVIQREGGATSEASPITPPPQPPAATPAPKEDELLVAVRKRNGADRR